MLAGLSGRQLDELAGLAVGHSSAIEGGRRANLESSTSTRVARVLGLSLDWLLAGVGDEPSRDAVLAAVERARASAVEETGT